MTDRLSIKNQAKILQDFLKQNNTPISHSACLQVIAKMQGYKDWNTFSAELNKENNPSENIIPLHDAPAFRHLSRYLTLTKNLPITKNVTLTMDQFDKTFQGLREEEKEKPSHFLTVWKKAIKLIGEDFFIIKSSVEEATDKWDLKPDYDAIKRNLFAKSTGQSLFLVALLSFYNREDGQDLLIQLGYPNFVDIFSRLEKEHVEILMALINYYQGW